ncbi:hypothetical protein FACS189440_21930 [Bacteroidia bacterium]|nr:hypothetical protein FACS189440_21930 [Bacteroidia bacterium]
MEVQDISFETESIKVPMQMEYMDNFLYFAEYNADYLIDVFDCSTGKLYNSFIPRGMGPDEYLWISSMVIIDNHLMLYDNSYKKITFLPKMGSETIEKPMDIIIKGDSIIQSSLNAFPLSKENYLISGIIKDAHWAIIDSVGSLISTFDTYPEDSYMEKKSTPADIAMAYQGRFISNPQKTKGLYTYDTGIILRFCDISEDGYLTRTKEYSHAHIEYTPKSKKDFSSVSFSKNNINSFIDLKGTEKYCFLLYSGLKFSEADEKAGEWYSGNRILIYDWDGNPIREILLPSRYNMFAVDTNHRLLYLLKTNTEESANDDYSISMLDLSADFEAF